MAKKRLFQVLDDLNVEDINNGTALVSVSSNFLSIDKIKQGAKISMGVPEQYIYDIMNEKVIPVMIMVDREEYFKRMEE